MNQTWRKKVDWKAAGRKAWQTRQRNAKINHNKPVTNIAATDVLARAITQLQTRQQDLVKAIHILERELR